MNIETYQIIIDNLKIDVVRKDIKNLHFNALNKALGKKYEINWDEHLSLYDGLKTMQKLKMI